jgi:biotin transport system substrate-specific component
MNIRTFKVIDSTHDYALKNFDQLKSETVVTALKQIFGRGQQTNTWESNEGGLYYSLVLKDIHFEPLYWIQITSVAVKRVLRSYNVNVNIKYPNDIIWNNHKLGGILITQKDNGAVISIGLNVNQEGFNQEKRAISLKLISDHLFDLNTLCTQVTAAITTIINHREDVKSEYLNGLNLSNKIIDQKKISHVDEQLMIQFKDGTRTKIDQLDTSEFYYGGKIRKMMLIAVMISLLSSTSWFAIPFIPGLPPITLQTLWIMLIATILDLRSGLMVVIIYILMGTLGLPVFSGGSSGITQYYGYILGFIPMLLFINIGQRFIKGHWKSYVQPLMLAISSITLYVIGTLFLMQFNDLPFLPTLISHSIFLPGDILKIIVVMYAGRLISKTTFIKSISSFKK